MNDEASSAAGYTTLAARLCGNRCVSVMLRRIAADERQHLKRLQAACFIETGDTFSPETKKPSPVPVLSKLRAMYLDEAEAVKAYTRAAEEDPVRADLYRCIAADEKRHAGMLKDLIEMLFR